MSKTADDAKVYVIIPTAINTVLMVNENIVYNLRKQQSANVELLSLYKRAYMIVNETDEVAIIRQGEAL